MISVIIPVYNVSLYLEECVKSIINQTYKEIEIILVDDGSTDDSGKKCDYFAQQDKRIRVVHKNNGGLSSARNAGIEVAKSDYITFVDSDDYVCLDMLERLYGIINGKDNLGIVTCLLENFYENGSKNRILKKYENGVYSSKEFADLMLRQKIDNAACGKLYRRSVVGDTRFKVGILNEDIIFNMQLLIKKFDVMYTDYSLYKYRIRSGSITTTLSPRRYEFVKNAFTIKDMLVPVYGQSILQICDGYIYKQISDYIALLAKHNVREAYQDNILECKSILRDTSCHGMLNSYWSTSDKVKYIIAMYCPTIYNILINIIRKSV